MKKKYKVVMLPTSDKSPLGMHNGELDYAPDYGFSVFNNKLNHEHNPQHLYFTSEEEIKVDDWITDGYRVWQWKDDCSLLGRKKIVATTDNGLFSEEDIISYTSLPQIPQSFLKEYCKNPVEEVEVEMYDRFTTNQGLGYQQYGIYNISKIINNKVYGKINETGNPFNQDLSTPFNLDSLKQEGNKFGVKLNSDNTINIIPTKTSWSREELEEELFNYRHHAWKHGLSVKTLDNWIKENL